MGVITKVNSNEGRHIVGYSCDYCGTNGGVDVIQDSAFTGWYSDGESVYCSDCYTENYFQCFECGKPCHYDNHCAGDVCENCWTKLNGD